jgi:hypothetical protein
MLDDFVIPEFEATLNNIGAEEIYLNRLFEYYHQRLILSPKIYKAVITLGLTQENILEKKLGYCDRTLKRFINDSLEINSYSFRNYLKSVKLIKVSGHELFRGCVIEPVFDDQNNLTSACGIKVNNRIRRNASNTICWYLNNVYCQFPSFKLKDVGGKYDKRIGRKRPSLKESQLTSVNFFFI